MVSDNLAGSRERDWAFFYSVVNAVMGVHYCAPAVLGKGAVDGSRAAPTKAASTVEDLQLLGLSISHQPG